MVISLGSGADLHMAQLIPLLLTISCSSKSRLVLPEWFCFSGAGLPTTQVVLEKRPLNECSSSSSSISSSSGGSSSSGSSNSKADGKRKTGYNGVKSFERSTG